MADTDILTMPEALTAVNLPSTSHSTELQVFVTGITGRIDELCGPVVQRTITDEAHDGGCARVFLDYQHVASITSVSEYSGTTETVLSEETNASKPASGFMLYEVEPYAWLIRRGSNSDSLFPAGRRNVVTTYTAGRYADTAAVDATFKLAVSSVLRRMWKRESSSWSQTVDFFQDTENPRPTLMFFKAVDPMIRELLADRLLPPVGI